MGEVRERVEVPGHLLGEGAGQRQPGLPADRQVGLAVGEAARAHVDAARRDDEAIRRGREQPLSRRRDDAEQAGRQERGQ
jgi:hypothetical protein